MGSTDGGHVLCLSFIKKQFHVENMKKMVLKNQTRKDDHSINLSVLLV